jgi:hypothetical protein
MRCSIGLRLHLPAWWLARMVTARQAAWLAEPWGALGTHNNEKRRLTLEDVERRFRRSGAVSGI